MIATTVLLLAAATTATATPSPRPPPTPWGRRGRSPVHDVALAEPTAPPDPTSLSEAASRIRLKRTGNEPIVITGQGKAGCIIPPETKDLPQLLGIANVGAAQVGRAIRIWFWVHGEGGREISAAVCATIEIWSNQVEIYHQEILLLPDDFSEMTLTSLLGKEQRHLGVVFRDRLFTDFLEPPASTVNVDVRIRRADGKSFESGETVYLTP